MRTVRGKSWITEMAMPVLFACCLFIAASVFAAKPLLAQRAWHQGDMWMKWSHGARESYVLGYFEGSAAIHMQGGERVSGTQVVEVDTAEMAKSITDFYIRYPEDRDIYIREVIEQLRKGLTLEQIHNYPFWRRSAPKTNP